MTCPKCPGQLESIVYGDVELDVCRVCFGLWFDRDELGKFNRFDADFPLGPDQGVRGKATRLRCPRCDGLLRKTRYDAGVNFAVERCPDCRGVWLDADEVARVQAVLEGDGKPPRRGPVRLAEVVRREQGLWVSAMPGGEWLFMFLTRLPREVYYPVARFPTVTVALIAANVLVFALQLAFWAGPEARELFLTYGFVPARIRRLEQPWAFLTSMFLHGGVVHLLGNMYFLYTFGDNVEDYLGALRFAGFYLLCGVAASLSHLAANLHSTGPAVGASGAIAGVLGAYCVLFRRRKVYLMIILWPIKVRAAWYLGGWVAFQILGASGGLPGRRGVAWFAHIGGFLAGVALALWSRARGTSARPTRTA